MSTLQRTAIVTGVSRERGIGRAVARQLIKEQYKVVGLDVEEPSWPHVDLTNFKFLQVDLTDEQQIEQTTNAAASWLSNRINVLVNNAGIAQPYMPKDRLNRKDAWRKYLATNLSAAFYMSEAVLPFMPSQNASIIHISSTRALQSEAHSEGYASAKAGLVGLTHSQAVSLGQACRVNVILPGYIHTEDEDPDSALSSEDHGWHLTGKVGRPEDIAQMCSFLACQEKSQFITGQQFVIDGGVTRKMIYPE